MIELPWDEPTRNSKEYTQWYMDDYITITPWKKMDNRALSLAKKILNPEPKNRLTIEKIICQPWVQTLYEFEGITLCILFSVLQEYFGLLLVLWQFSDVIVYIIHKARLPKH